MEVIKHISVDLSEKHNVPLIYATRGDAYLRKIKISLFNNGTAFEIDSSYNVLFAYKKSDGHGGMYDRLEDGSSAFELDYEPNTITVTLAEQVLNVPGCVTASITFVKAGKVLSTFPLVIDVSEQPGIDVAESKDYFVLGAAVDAVIAAAQKPVHIVEVYRDEDTSSYVKNYSFADIMDLIDSQSPIVCNWYDPEVILPLVQYRSDVVVVFSCVLDNTEYKVAIYADERVSASQNVISSGGNGEVGGDSVSDAVLYTPQTLTEEQKTQARDNIGACDKEYVDDAIANIDLPTGGNNATFRHIATLVFDENTNASHWSITQDEDGNALSLSHVFIRGDVLAADRKGDGAFRINDEIAIPWCFSMQTNGYTAIMDITMAGTTALVRYMSWESSTKANRFEAYRGRGSSSVISSLLCSNAAGVRIPSGSKFEVWGY